MSKQEMIERTQQSLDAFNRLPPEEQFRQMIAWGTIDANGEVQLSTNDDDKDSDETLTR